MKKYFKTSKFKKSESGTAGIEFAIILPFLLFVFFGVYQITTYVVAIRKIDNVTNDIGYILSREGCLANLVNTNSTNCAAAVTLQGGASQLQSIFDNVTPFLIFPYHYDNADGSSQIDVKFVGLPIFSTCTNDNVDRDHLRVMWEERWPPAPGPKGAHVTADLNDADQCTGYDTTCPNACNGKYYSFYKDSHGNRADIIYPGQSFIIVNFAFNFEALLGTNIVNLALPTNIEKLASYPTRTRIIPIKDANGVDQPTVLNNMQYCTDCNKYSSESEATGMNGETMTAGGSVYRQVCANPAPRATDADNSSGGCLFY